MLSLGSDVVWKLNLMSIKRTTTYDIGNLGPGLRRTQKCDRVTLVNGIPTLLS